MTRAFRLNLTALSMLALVCGVFLIYNTMTFSVVQRRQLDRHPARARASRRREIFALVLGEAAAVAVLGTAAGLGAGVLLGRGLVRLVTQTINDLYFVVSVRELAIPPATLADGALLGIGATLLAALVPAIEATQAPPRAALLRSTLEARLRGSLPRATAWGLGLLAAGAAAAGAAQPRGELRRAVRRDPGLRPALPRRHRPADAAAPPAAGRHSSASSGGWRPAVSSPPSRARRSPSPPW